MVNCSTQLKCKTRRARIVFVVFKDLEEQKEVEISEKKPIEILTLAHGWKVSFLKT
jgi:hypothetical protein